MKTLCLKLKGFRSIGLGVLLGAMASTGLADTLTWDATSSASGGSDGTGTWTNTSANWYSASLAATTSTSGGTDTVVFGLGNTTALAASDTVTLSGNVYVGNLTFNYLANNTTAYTISSTSAASSLYLGGLTGASAATITLNGIGGTSVGTGINAPIVNSGGLTILNSGSADSLLNFGGTLSNTGLTGPVTIGGNGKQVEVAIYNTGVFSSASSVTVGSSASLRLFLASNTFNFQNLVLGGGTGDASRGQLVYNATGETVTGAISLSGASARIALSAAVGTMSAVIGDSGAGRGVEYYTGTTGSDLILTSTSVNTYSGATTFNNNTAGTFTIDVNQDSNFGAAPAAAATNITFTAAGGTDVLRANASFTINANRNIALLAAMTGGLTINTQANTLTIGGIISGPAAVPVTKTGTGTLILAGNNTYTGTTSVSAGTLSVTGQLANTTTTVSSGATLTGTGTIAGATTVNTGGILAAGTATGTTLTFSNALTMASGSTLTFVLGAGNTNSTLSLAGATTVSLNSGMLVDFLNVQAGTYTNLITGCVGRSKTETRGGPIV